MRNSRQDRLNWAFSAFKCLNIGSRCTLCARSGIPEADICTACALQLRACDSHTDRRGITSSVCLGCGVETQSSQSQLPNSDPTQHADPLCATKLYSTDTGAYTGGYCGDCLTRTQPLLRQIVAPYRYAHPVDRLIKRIKYSQDRQLARVFGSLLGHAVLQGSVLPMPELLLPMPMHASRLRQRGFNQAQDIARWTGRYLGLPVAAGLVSRAIDTGSLAGLSRQERQHRILGAFHSSSQLVGRHVAIVDDVLTTGASARELAREVYDSGAESVELWVLARTSSLRTGV